MKSFLLYTIFLNVLNTVLNSKDKCKKLFYNPVQFQLYKFLIHQTKNLVHTNLYKSLQIFTNLCKSKICIVCTICKATNSAFFLLPAVINSAHLCKDLYSTLFADLGFVSFAWNDFFSCFAYSKGIPKELNQRFVKARALYPFAYSLQIFDL